MQTGFSKMKNLDLDPTTQPRTRLNKNAKEVMDRPENDVAQPMGNQGANARPRIPVTVQNPPKPQQGTYHQENHLAARTLKIGFWSHKQRDFWDVG